MHTELQGVLIAVGTPPESAQPRALIQCTEDQIRSVKMIPMMQPVAVVATAELAALRQDRANLIRALDMAVGQIRAHGSPEVAEIADVRVRIASV